MRVKIILHYDDDGAVIASHTSSHVMGKNIVNAVYRLSVLSSFRYKRKYFPVHKTNECSSRENCAL
jgi:hypothetical protein